MTHPWCTIPGGQEVRLTNDTCITNMYLHVYTCLKIFNTVSCTESYPLCWIYGTGRMLVGSASQLTGQMMMTTTLMMMMIDDDDSRAEMRQMIHSEFAKRRKVCMFSLYIPPPNKVSFKWILVHLDQKYWCVDVKRHLSCVWWTRGCSGNCILLQNPCGVNNFHNYKWCKWNLVQMMTLRCTCRCVKLTFVVCVLA